VSLRGFVFVSDETAFSEEGACATLDGAALDALRAAAERSPRRNARLCAHASPAATLHEMFICHRNNAYVRPHRHVGKAESIHVVSGLASAIVFADDGRIAAVHELGTSDSGRNFFVRFDAGVYHTLLVESGTFIFHETTLGPFRREDTVFAPWSPAAEAPEECARYLAKLTDQRASWPNRSSQK